MFGGRWNRPGTEVIYTTASRSLAVLEIMVHYAVLPKDFVLTQIHIPDHVEILTIREEDLPPNWNQPDPIPATSDFVERLYPKTAVLSVPSAIIADERNYVLNPIHRDFRHIRFLPSKPFKFDPRLK